jgi:hypothetical protein
MKPCMVSLEKESPNISPRSISCSESPRLLSFKIPAIQASDHEILLVWPTLVEDIYAIDNDVPLIHPSILLWV